MSIMDELTHTLTLEPIEVNLFRGFSPPDERQRIFGGQVVAQALTAAYKTVDDRVCHSLQSYFIRPGDPTMPVLYQVERSRDGKSFTTRRVTAIQHGRAIFNMSTSFHHTEEGVSHQAEMPDVPPPETVRPEVELLRDIADRIPERLRAVLTQDRPLDIRPIDPLDPFNPAPHPPTRRFWVRARGQLSDQPLDHQAVLAYASDYGLLGAALQPHALSYRNPDVMVASLDHSIWFHRPFRVDEWLLYDVESPAAYGARGFSRGSYFTQRGELVASVAQEGLVRVIG